MNTRVQMQQDAYILISRYRPKRERHNSIEVDAPASPKKLDYKAENALVLEDYAVAMVNGWMSGVLFIGARIKMNYCATGEATIRTYW